MHATSRLIRFPKRGHSEEECEDAHAGPVAGPGGVLAAVADGATESAFAADWARRLAQAFVETGADGFAAALPALRAAWQVEHDRRAGALPWYAEAKLREGSFAALLGLEVAESGRWRACCAGDCCLFHLTGARIASWPFTRPEEFHARPRLLGSLPVAEPPELSSRAGEWAPGDRFVLATDAAAAWLLRRPELLRAFDAANAAESLRQVGRDDVTMLWMEPFAQAGDRKR